MPVDPHRHAQLRKTAAQWTTDNPILGAGVFAVESDTNNLKVGDGTTAWTSLSYRLEDTGWQTPTLINSWEHYSAGTYPFRYRRLNKVVYLVGLVRNGTINTNIAVLPAGFRPLWDAYFVAHGYTGGAYAESHWVIQTTGAVRHLWGGNTQCALNGITYIAEG
jgi:hypothetical protein